MGFRTITVPWKCRCSATERTIDLHARMPDEDILDFMDRLQAALTVEHRRLSPLCVAAEMEYVKVPTPDGQGPGFAPRLNS